MESSGSSSVNDPQMEVDPVEGEVNLAETSKDLLRVHVRLIMAGVLTMEESKPVLSRAFFALWRLSHDAASALLLYDCDCLELLLARREKERSRRPSVEAAYQVAQERVEGDWGEGWSGDEWRGGGGGRLGRRVREAILLDRRTREQRTTLSRIEGEIRALIA